MTPHDRWLEPDEPETEDIETETDFDDVEINDYPED
jgi:hypothetical protein